MATLTANIQMIQLQFSFSNPSLVPVCLQRLEKETFEQAVKRRVEYNGRQTIAPTENCSVRDVLQHIEATGFVMVAAHYQKRIDTRNKDKKYAMVRFVFALQANANEDFQHPLFKQWKDKIRAALEDMVNMAFWRARCFVNPFVKNDEIVPGKEMVSMNFEARVPLFKPDGGPVLARRKVDGTAVGDPVPLEPSFTLSMEDGEFRLVPC